jgi:hypothetical protein
MKCPNCGSEYYSSGSTCFACSELDRNPKGIRRARWKRRSVRGFGLILSMIGAILLIRGEHLVPDDGVEGLATFAASLSALGIVIIAYSLLYSQTSLKEYREGKEFSNRMAARLTALGIGLITFGTLYILAAVCIGFDSDSVGAVGLVMPLSFILITASLLRLPKALFATEETELRGPLRTLVGTLFIVIGLAIEAAAIINFNMMWYWIAIVVGPAVILAGLTTLSGPMIRPWIHETTLRESEEDAHR